MQEPSLSNKKPLSTFVIMLIVFSGFIIFGQIVSLPVNDKTDPADMGMAKSSPTAPVEPHTDCERVASAIAEVAMANLGYDDVVGFCRNDGTIILKFDDLKRGQIIRTAALLEPLVSQAKKDSRTETTMRQVSKVCVTNGGILSREERCFYLH